MIKYYTDVHDVDEDRMAISCHGGRWDQEIEVGIAYREMYSTPTMVYSSVASLKKNKD